MSEPAKWTYTIQLQTDEARIYGGEHGGEKRGMTWSLTRSCKHRDGTTYWESIVSSPEVFDERNAALEDALRKLSILRCPLEQPLDYAIRDLLEGF